MDIPMSNLEYLDEEDREDIIPHQCTVSIFQIHHFILRVCASNSDFSHFGEHMTQLRLLQTRSWEISFNTSMLHRIFCATCPCQVSSIHVLVQSRMDNLRRCHVKPRCSSLRLGQQHLQQLLFKITILAHPSQSLCFCKQPVIQLRVYFFKRLIWRNHHRPHCRPRRPSPSSFYVPFETILSIRISNG